MDIFEIHPQPWRVAPMSQVHPDGRLPVFDRNGTVVLYLQPSPVPIHGLTVHKIGERLIIALNNYPTLENKSFEPASHDDSI